MLSSRSTANSLNIIHNTICSESDQPMVRFPDFTTDYGAYVRFPDFTTDTELTYLHKFPGSNAVIEIVVWSWFNKRRSALLACVRIVHTSESDFKKIKIQYFRCILESFNNLETIVCER